MTENQSGCLVLFHLSLGAVRSGPDATWCRVIQDSFQTSLGRRRRPADDDQVCATLGGRTSGGTEVTEIGQEAEVDSDGHGSPAGGALAAAGGHAV